VSAFFGWVAGTACALVIVMIVPGLPVIASALLGLGLSVLGMVIGARVGR